MFDSTNERRNEPHFFRCKCFFRSLFVTHANLPALFPLMRVRSDNMKKIDWCRFAVFSVDSLSFLTLRLFFFFCFFSLNILDFCSIKLKTRRSICLFCIEILRHISGPLLYIFVLCLECIFFCFFFLMRFYLFQFFFQFYPLRFLSMRRASLLSRVS